MYNILWKKTPNIRNEIQDLLDVSEICLPLNHFSKNTKTHIILINEVLKVSYLKLILQIDLYKNVILKSCIHLQTTNMY